MKIGIVGLPNVGKSTLFNSITNAGAECANYPFCTIEPNVGVVPVPDERLEVLTNMYNPAISTNSIIACVVFSGLYIFVNTSNLSSGTGTTPTFGSIVQNG